MDGQDDEYYASYDSYRMAPQCKLLETIYEHPKLSTNGRKQFTSVRKYKRFIDFTAGPTATKKWKRSQKARKLASTRLVHAFQASDPCDDPQHSLRPMRNVRARMPPLYESRSFSQGCSEPRTRPQGVFKAAVAASGRVCETGDGSARHEWHEPRVVSVCTGNLELPETFVVSSTDLIVEEAATVELPPDCRNKEETLGIDFNTEYGVHECDKVTSEGSTGTSWCYALPCSETKEDQAAFCYSSDDSSQLTDCRNSGLCEKSSVELFDKTVPSENFYTVCERRPLHAWAACQEDNVSNSLMELAAVVETRHCLCESVVRSSGACVHQNGKSYLLNQAVEASSSNNVP